MKIQYCSDLHLELPSNSKYMQENPIPAVGKILLLAGDITIWSKKHFKDKFFDDVSSKFERVYWVPGNHEFYGGEDLMAQDEPFLHEIRDNVYLVNNKSVVIDNVEFIFSTFWSDVPLLESFIVQQSVSDFYRIRYHGRTLTIKKFNELHQQCLDFVKDAVQRSKYLNKVVVTHHVPTHLCNSEKYKTSMINAAFVSEHYDFIDRSFINAWIYGHHHENMKPVTINGTQVITNQLGYYPTDKDSKFDPTRIIEI